MELRSGLVVGSRYRLERLLIDDHIGQLWAARHEITGRISTLKLLRSGCEPNARRRFVRETGIATRAVAHPNVVRVENVFEMSEGMLAIMMEPFDGESLGRKLTREGALPLQVVASIFLPVVSALGTAHARGVIHGNLTPEKVFFRSGPVPANELVMLEFTPDWLLRNVSFGDELVSGTTTAGAIATHAYTCLEQSLSELPRVRSADIWSLGIMLYEALSGWCPTDGADAARLLRHILGVRVTPIRMLVPELSQDVANIVDHLLRRDPEERPHDLRPVAAVLARYSSVVAPYFGPAI